VDGEDEEVPAECGNGIIDGDEECDDGRNGDPDDGCTDECLYSCHDNTECLDAELCNGDETCNEDTHICRPGTAREDGFVCQREPRGICLAGQCEESTCGDGFLDTGGGEFCEITEADCRDNCTFDCSGDEDCPDDGNVCNGEEYCNLEHHQCDRRNPLDDGAVCSGSPRKICIAQTCQESSCGDSYIDDATGEECDDANFIEGDGCDNDCLFSCHNDSECDDGMACTEDICLVEIDHTCTSSITHEGITCRPPTGDCDIEESCDGVSPECPRDAFSPNVTVCRPAADECDVLEYCTGSSAECPTDEFQPVGTDCDDDIYCTETEVCDGSGFCGGPVTPYLYDIIEISTSFYHTCALISSGEIRCWGRNNEGQLGDGTTTDRSAPVSVADLPAPAARISAGGYHTCAALTTGEMMCWGRNDAGQLGNGTTSGSPLPVRVSLETPPAVLSISCGLHHACVLLENDTIKCWGRNAEGQLGDGTTTERDLPTEVTGLTDTVAGISAGRYHTCALTEEGRVLCWGTNAYGELGDGTTDNRTQPVIVSDITSIGGISAGIYHTCALEEGGTGVWCWGRNNEGQLGDGSLVPSLVPVAVSGLDPVISAVVAGGYHTCVFKNSGEALCWGRNDEGQVGNDTTSRQILPVDVSGLSDDVTAMALGFYHTCALIAAGGVMCWGVNGTGEIGDGSTDNRLTPVDVHCQ